MCFSLLWAATVDVRHQVLSHTESLPAPLM
ncbi:hypothetical protein FHS26_005930 [Rhizobium pisi]|uniref:Uncharacterized protein n=1 Tax=Rhizobium pisi TaxID=574561 RepID=A0A7W5G2Q2_9HYPH|nr:hypothetical protein [Rhizobium pisi]